MSLKTADFFYDLPPELIAQSPSEKRDHSRLLVLDRKKTEPRHRHFFDLPEYLERGDCLVLNNSRVIPARLLGEREGGGFAELLLLSDKGGNEWECLARPGRRITAGTRLSFGGGLLKGEVTAVLPSGNRLVRFDYDGLWLPMLEKLGVMPLPPYITKKLDDPERYQTVYARAPGSVAAPTAGLHFTPELLDEIARKGVSIAEVTLHVGLGTFRPVKVSDISEHVMHSEVYEVSQAAADTVNGARAAGGRIIAVGTTACRTLEAAGQGGVLRPGSGQTDIFITPGYEFSLVDALVTNFHLPESTLVMLVSALAGRERILEAYGEAIREKYRFFSFGDAMLIL